MMKMLNGEVRYAGRAARACAAAAAPRALIDIRREEAQR